MRLIDVDLLKQVFERNVVGAKAYRVLFDNAPTVPAIPIDRIKQLREEMKDISFSHYFELGQYIGEDTKKWEVVKLKRALDLIDNMIREYEG